MKSCTVDALEEILYDFGTEFTKDTRRLINYLGNYLTLKQKEERRPRTSLRHLSPLGGFF